MIKWLPLLLLTGCMSNDSLRTLSMSQDNIWNLSRLCIGMDESQVLQIMHYPYSKKTIETTAETYQIWFYVTKSSGLAQSRLVRQNLTPLTFENGILRGWGYEFYNYTLKRIQPGVAAPEPTEKSNRHEDRSFEKALEGAQQSQATTENENSPKNTKDKKDKSKNKDKKEDKDPLDKEDEDMINEGEDQNFNFW
jgi:hypothetical protein